ncbi:hypothetical protein CTA2_10918 [Colletotrichum tanaceti]|uniref:Secreted protein n=1 Tax=Colletotrichum tanaceti TaxID=1306861 RepID=A0A4U6WZB8_9PEZI|nr:hypothetical protein CTA2_10918 [Colletotrichum tanaceti]TKW48468.1 hypothetical protein CTA1_12569 [Colletotrichum tanaceti]
MMNFYQILFSTLAFLVLGLHSQHPTLIKRIPHPPQIEVVHRHKGKDKTYIYIPLQGQNLVELDTICRERLGPRYEFASGRCDKHHPRTRKIACYDIEEPTGRWDITKSCGGNHTCVPYSTDAIAPIGPKIIDNVVWPYCQKDIEPKPRKPPGRKKKNETETADQKQDRPPTSKRPRTSRELVIPEKRTYPKGRPRRKAVCKTAGPDDVVRGCERPFSESSTSIYKDNSGTTDRQLENQNPKRRKGSMDEEAIAYDDTPPIERSDGKSYGGEGNSMHTEKEQERGKGASEKDDLEMGFENADREVNGQNQDEVNGQNQDEFNGQNQDEFPSEEDLQWLARVMNDEDADLEVNGQNQDESLDDEQLQWLKGILDSVWGNK